MAYEFDKKCIGFYHEDGLIYLKIYIAWKVECARKNFVKVFKNYGLNFKVTSNLKTVNFQDVTFNLGKRMRWIYKTKHNGIYKH